MKNLDQLTSSLHPSPLNRRNFLEQTGKGLVAATLMGSVTSVAGQPIQGPGKQKILPSDLVPVQLKPIDHPSEKPEAPPPTPAPPEKRIGFAIVGLGKLTLNQLLPAFGSCKKCKLVALVSGNRAKAEKVAAQYGVATKNIYNYQNFDEIKNNPEIDVVYIVLPNGMHAEYTIRAAQAGKHVLCEKPMANTSKEAQQMIDACKKADKKLMIAYRIQYEPYNNLAKQWTRDKKFGKVKIIEAVNVQNTGDPNQWRLKKSLSGGGSMPDIGIYCLNTARFLLGEEPDWVFANIYSTPNDPRFKEVEESVMFQLHFPSGTLVNNVTCYGVHDSKRYRAYADNGGWFGLDPAFSYSGLKMEASQIMEEKEYKLNPSMEEKDQFALEMDHMAMCVNDNKQPFTPGEEGLQDMKLIEAVYKSAKEGKPVQLEKITTLDTFRGSKPEKS